MATKKTELKTKTAKAPASPKGGMEAPVYNAQGKKAGTITLPENVFGVQWNNALMHQVVTGMQANARPSVAHAKMRGEVRGGGRKPWQQKGTGRARHGSTRSPIWKGGGVTHGPRNDKDYSQNIPRKMRAKALFAALSRKFRDGEVLFVDSFGIQAPKTASAKKALVMLSKVSGFEKLANKSRNAALIALPDESYASAMSFRNIGNITTVPLRGLNPVAILGNSYLIIENAEAGIALMTERALSKPRGKEGKSGRTHYNKPSSSQATKN
jgi:large subunit ribosomal protein L4